MNSRTSWKAYWQLVQNFPSHVFNSVARFVWSLSLLLVSAAAVILGPFVILSFSLVHWVIRKAGGR